MGRSTTQRRARNPASCLIALASAPRQQMAADCARLGDMTLTRSYSRAFARRLSTKRRQLLSHSTEKATARPCRPVSTVALLFDQSSRRRPRTHLPRPRDASAALRVEARRARRPALVVDGDRARPRRRHGHGESGIRPVTDRRRDPDEADASRGCRWKRKRGSETENQSDSFHRE
jgi:hypothetical protein